MTSICLSLSVCIIDACVYSRDLFLYLKYRRGVRTNQMAWVNKPSLKTSNFCRDLIKRQLNLMITRFNLYNLNFNHFI